MKKWRILKWHGKNCIRATLPLDRCQRVRCFTASHRALTRRVCFLRTEHTPNMVFLSCSESVLCATCNGEWQKLYLCIINNWAIFRLQSYVRSVDFAFRRCIGTRWCKLQLEMRIDRLILGIHVDFMRFRWSNLRVESVVTNDFMTTMPQCCQWQVSRVDDFIDTSTNIHEQFADTHTTHTLDSTYINYKMKTSRLQSISVRMNCLTIPIDRIISMLFPSELWLTGISCMCALCTVQCSMME